MSLQQVEHRASFGGWQNVYAHDAQTLGCRMRVAVYLPPVAQFGPVPALYWLSGLTCTEQNFITKGHAQRYAAEAGIALIAPDTSPRGEQVPDAERYDLGQGAGFYLNASAQPWAEHYRMYDYIVDELPRVLAEQLPLNGLRSISGHSMGGHGALTIALKNPGLFRSVSAFSPIVAPSQVPWGQQAFSAYLGDDREQWKAWDSCELIATAGEQLPLLIDQGEADEFLREQLRPELLQQAAEKTGHPLQLRMQPGYDHSYYFVSSFIGDHIAHHARALKA